MTKEQIGELSIAYDNEGLGTLLLEVYEMEIGDKRVDINTRLSDKDKEELSDLLTRMNDIIVSKINEIIQESVKEGD